MARTRTSPAGSELTAIGNLRATVRGFTLLELLLALALMALGAALVIPALVTPAASEVRTAAGQVASLLRQAREHALSTQSQAVVAVDTEARRFEAPARLRVPRLGETLELALVTARSELEGQHAGRIRFFSDGSSTGGRVTVSRAGHRVHVDIDWLTGRIHMFDPDAEDDPGVLDSAVVGQ